MTDDDRRSFNNLILLCKPHHELVDKRHADRYTAEDLEGWKASREGGEATSLSEIGPITEAHFPDNVWASANVGRPCPVRTAVRVPWFDEANPSTSTRLPRSEA